MSDCMTLTYFFYCEVLSRFFCSRHYIGVLVSNNNNSHYYGALSAFHIFLPVAVETAGTWNQSTIELIQEIGRRIIAVTKDTRETVFLFQRLSIALQRVNVVAFLATFNAV